MISPIRLALFASGSGTNVVAILENLPKSLKVEFVFSDQPTALVLGRIKKYSVTTYVVPRLHSRESHENAIMYLIKKHKIDWICLAGYMRVLSKDFVTQFKNIVNIHPSLLPCYPGIQAIERAYADGVQESGVTLHWVDQGIDTGKVIYQEKVIRNPQESFLEFKQKIQACEYQIYKKFLNDLAGGLYAENCY